MAQGEKGFRRFLEHTVQWQNFQLLTEAYEQQRIDIEAQAVRDANKKLGKILTPADIQRIRQQARNDMIMIDPHKLKNLIREFDIMIIRADAQSGEQTTQENGQLLALGHYDGEKLEMAMYDDVKAMLFQENNLIISIFNAKVNVLRNIFFILHRKILIYHLTIKIREVWS